MTTLNLNDELINAVRVIADRQHTTPEKLIHEALQGLIEDYHDIQSAEAALKRIESGEDRTYTLDEARAYLNELDS
ncbi:DUF6290 family protein [Methylotuvimicrobium alcaliphilum]|uniref:CopG family transcriptional regulator n=1 Tax=Methylotuvimicrobium alcaliphilum (strain DSM 19304 / NCIMB 14124 / VKM B-2133 / 20Z) TaxID=1091494 RepID=G4SVB8_META2|nr:DUF6290 family protein [Methylotuvimicrobium alcaliphilum]CCE21894.1 conserved protein of unknown function [Methylotuvimicrobium alcaliphilum 20Z]